MNLDGVFMDMYGTITTGDRAAVEEVCRQIIAENGLALPAHQLAITWGERFFQAMDSASGDGFQTLVQIESRTLVETMTALGVDVDPAPYVAQLSAYWQAPPLQPEVRDFLAAFEVPICIVSNADRADLDAALAYHRLEVAGVVTSEDARSYKPDRKIFEDALRLTGWRREHVLHVGDSLHSDVGGALQVGLGSVWINRVHRIHDIGNHRPDYEFENLSGLLSLTKGG